MADLNANYTEFYSDKLDIQNISSLSLLLCPHKITIIAKDHNGSISGVHIYRFKETEELKNILNKDQFLNASNNPDTKTYLYHEKFCLVPGMLFDPGQKAVYLNFSAPLEEEEVFYEGIENNNMVLVSAVEKEIKEILMSKTSSLSFSHGAAVVLDFLFHEKADMLNQEIAVVVEDSHIYLAGFTNRELHLFNRFEIQGNQDFLKYTFSALHQLAFDRMHCKISLIGNLQDINVQEEVLHKYFKNIVMVTPKINQNYLPGAERYKETKMLSAFWTN